MGVEPVACRVRVAEPPATTVAGFSDAVMPDGRPATVNATDSVKPFAAVVVTAAVSVAALPPVIAAAFGSTAMVKSSLPPPPTIGCVIRQPPLPPPTSLDHEDCTANEPVANGTFAIAPGPERSHAHLSAFSSPPASVQPPAGFWSVIVSAYSCPSTIVTPSRRPAVPVLTKFWPQLPPASATYGRLVNAMSPTVDGIGPPFSVPSPFQSCQAQKPALGKLSGCVPCADTTTYWALRFFAALVLPKWDAAVTASIPISCSVAVPGAAVALSTHTPASAPPIGYATCGALAGQASTPAGTPSQYWVVTPDHNSLSTPTPLKNCCSRGAMPSESPESVVLPPASVPAVPNCDPQKTRYTFGLPVVTPIPSTPPP